MSIRLIISAISMLSLLTVSIVILLLTLSEQETITQETLGERLVSVATNLGNDLFPVVSQPNIDEISVMEYLLRLSAYDSIYFAYITDEKANLVSLYRGEDLPSDWQYSPQIENRYKDNTFLKEQSFIVTRQPIGENSNPIGTVVIVENITGKLANSQTRLIWGIAPLLLVGFLIIVAITIAAMNRFSTPVIKLAQSTIRIAKSRNFDNRVSSDGTQEVKKLTDSINFLLSEIGAQLADNRHKNKQLVNQRDEMERLANFDVLTSLPNRQFVLKCLGMDLARAKRHQSDFAILFFDLDGFKHINDSLGHVVGDQLLVEVANRVKPQLREGDLFARLGGDEFLIKLHGHVDMNSLDVIGCRLIGAFNTLIEVEQWKLDVNISVGIAKATDAGYDLQTLISYADTAMYESKKQGKGLVTLFNDSMLEEVQKRMKIRTLLKHAISNNELYTVLQPRVGRNSQIESFEVLCRWNSPELGEVMPFEFIPVAEQSNVISDITQWVVAQSLIHWQLLSVVYGPNLKISVNVSARDLHRADIFEAMVKDAGRKKIPASAIELEVTETSYLHDIGIAKQFCKTMQNEGCNIAIDDFGTGYSSLGFLSQMDFDTIKIDRSFVQDIGKSRNADMVIKTVIQLAIQLGANTCAEGVETEEQKAFLLENGASELQGYLFGRPQSCQFWLEQKDAERSVS